MIAHTAPTSPTFSRRTSLDKMKTMPSEIIRAAGYIRVSTDKQAEHGSSLEAQEAQIKQYALAHGYDLKRNYIDGGFSAKNLDRPAFRELFAEVEAGRIDVIIVSKIDRLTRSARDFYNFIEDYVSSEKVNIVSIGDGLNTLNPISRVLIPLLVSIGQIERHQTAERVKRSIAFIREQGGHYGKVPYGYQTESDGKIKRLVPHPEEQAHLANMTGLYQSGKSFEEIAVYLNEQGVKPRQIKAWTENAVYELLIKNGVHKVRSVQSEAVCDRQRAYEIAYQLRSDDRTYSYIADQLNKAGLRPQKAARYEWYSVQELLRSAVYHDRSTAQGYARYLQGQGKSLRAIADALLNAGHRPKRGGQWYPQTVKQLLVS